jgi:anti-sigma factor RsiW
MHNCKLTRNGLVDLALDEVPSAEAEQLLSELNGCSSCREEYAALRNTWRISGQALQSALPTEEFWPGYHARLKSKLSQHMNQVVEQDSQEAPQPSLNLLLGLRVWGAVVMQTASLGSLGWKLVTTSVRVPVPVALALVFLFGVVVLSLAGRASISPGEAANAIPSTQLPSIETRLVEVPVIQERVVTRVVYVEKKSSRSNVSSSPNREDGFARAGSDTSAETALSLVGFKPTDQVNLSIIKGNHDEK